MRRDGGAAADRPLVAAQVAGHHARIGADLCGGTDRQGVAEPEVLQPVADADHQRQVVLDQDHGGAGALAQVQQKRTEGFRLALGQPRGGFVQQKQRGAIR